MERNIQKKINNLGCRCSHRKLRNIWEILRQLSMKLTWPFITTHVNDNSCLIWTTRIPYQRHSLPLQASLYDLQIWKNQIQIHQCGRH